MDLSNEFNQHCVIEDNIFSELDNLLAEDKEENNENQNNEDEFEFEEINFECEEKESRFYMWPGNWDDPNMEDDFTIQLRDEIENVKPISDEEMEKRFKEVEEIEKVLMENEEQRRLEVLNTVKDNEDNAIEDEDEDDEDEDEDEDLDESNDDDEKPTMDIDGYANNDINAVNADVISKVDINSDDNVKVVDIKTEIMESIDSGDIDDTIALAPELGYNTSYDSSFTNTYYDNEATTDDEFPQDFPLQLKKFYAPSE